MKWVKWHSLIPTKQNLQVEVNILRIPMPEPMALDSKTWTFNWTPEEASGDVTFYVAVNASDDEDDASGDHIYTSSVTITEDPDNHPLSIEEMNDILFDIHGIVQDELAVTVSTPVNNPIVIDIIDIQRTVGAFQQISICQWHLYYAC
jgi:hypothetical protein